ncbi:MAG: hypothetical protein GF330_15000 [Candidatus Eisenbacteria bacterium]|nr:hypothetical protein [Candidatus Eisenbacteria bacterium]
MTARSSGEGTRQAPHFQVRDCALIAQASGRSAQNLRELAEGLRYVRIGSIYYHFWGRFLRPTFDEPEYNNDFASWTHHDLQDNTLAERLSVINPADFPDLEDLRQELVDVVEARLDESESAGWVQAPRHFYFIQAQTIVFDTGAMVEEPRQLAEVVPRMSSGSIFYHFIDAQRRTPDHTDDFSQWLADLGDRYAELRERIVAIDPYFASIRQLRGELSELLTDFFEEGQL